MAGPSDDCMKVYDELLRQGYDPKKMIFMGESAGGTLVLSTALRLAAEASPSRQRWLLFRLVRTRRWDFPLIPKT